MGDWCMFEQQRDEEIQGLRARNGKVASVKRM